MRFKSIAVFCASSPGFDAVWTQRAYGVGEFLATQNITLVYGGGRVGLMGAVADGALANNGKVVGVIPHFLNSKEIGHSGVTDLIAVDNMHQRKTLMNDLSEAFIALPGGYGTMEEVFEVITWGQLGLHQKPVGLLNINGFYDHLIAFLQNMVDVGLLKKQNQEMLLVGNTIEELLEKMNSYVAPAVSKWLSKENS